MIQDLIETWMMISTGRGSPYRLGVHLISAAQALSIPRYHTVF